MSQLTDTEILRQNVRIRLAHMGRSLENVATANGYKRSRMAHWITGNPTLSTMSKLAIAFGVPTFELINPDFISREYPIPDVLREGAA